MTTRTVTMSHSELDRFGIITRVRERRLTQVEAARILDLGVRQVPRLCAAMANNGADGLIARKRGTQFFRFAACAAMQAVYNLYPLYVWRFWENGMLSTFQ